MCLQMPMTSGVMEWRLASLIARTEGIETMISARTCLENRRLASLIARTEGIETIGDRSRAYFPTASREPHRPHRGH